jgi:hypothetical protein
MNFNAMEYHADENNSRSFIWLFARDISTTGDHIRATSRVLAGPGLAGQTTGGSGWSGNLAIQGELNDR